MWLTERYAPQREWAPPALAATSAMAVSSLDISSEARETRRSRRLDGM